MSLNQKHRKNITALFCIIFYALMIFKWFGGLFLYQLQPYIFNTRFDLFAWLLMSTGLHRWLIGNMAGCMILDIVFYMMPLVYWLGYLKNTKAARVVAVCMLLVNWIYVQCYTLYPANSIESYMAWLLFPVLFITVRLRSFFFVLQALRYFFLFFFFSAGVWKLVQQGIFHVDEMSGVLLYQHKDFLASSPTYWVSRMLYWLIGHPTISYLLYLAGTLVELFFVAGFFTKKFDPFLIAGFILFLVLDVFFMRIYYWEMLPFLIPLYFSRLRLPLRDRV